MKKAESKEVTTQEDNRNYFTDYGSQAGGQSNIVGKLLKFSKGDYMAGADNDEVEEDTLVVVNMDSILVGWQRWQDNKPAEQLMGAISEGFQPARRADLGYDDEDKWEVDDQGKARDPWQFSNVALMRAIDAKGKGGELYTFATSSKGGIGAVGRLCVEYGKVMREKPDVWPAITLGVGSYVHPNKAYGRIKFPVFDVISWEKKSLFDDVDKAEDKKAERKASKPKALTSRRA